MDYKYINQLLERYWQCETTLEEEQILRSFFSQLNVPRELERYRSLFVYEQTEPKADRLGDDFDERLMSAIGQPDKVQARRITMKQRLTPLYKAAAAVAIVLTLSNAAQFSFRNDNYTEVPASPAASHGVSVALNDSARADSMKRSFPDVGQTQSTAILK